MRSFLNPVRRRLLNSLHRRTVPLGNAGPVVSFSFDDFPRSAYTVGGSILKKYQARGTYFVAMGLMDSVNNLGEQFHLEDLHCLVNDGHELASHTYGHSSSWSVSLSEFERDVRKGRAAIREVVGIEDSANFAYPYGEATLATKKNLGWKMTSSRGTCGGLNGPDVDVNLLRANSLNGDRDQLDRAKKIILDNVRRKSWLIFYLHDVSPTPSRYGCTPSLLEATLSFALEQESRVLTIADVLAEIGCGTQKHGIKTVSSCPVVTT